MKRSDLIVLAQLAVGMVAMAAVSYVILAGLEVTGLYDALWYVIPVWLGAVLLWAVVIRPVYDWLTKGR